MVITLEQFVERLTRSGLMSPDEVSAFQNGLLPERRPKDVQSLARELVRAGRLTKYQAQAVYQGKGKGLVLGNYLVLDRIGSGGMGEVLKARHRRMDRIVALKMLPAKAVDSPAAGQRFQREVKAAARLTHPNIVTAYDADEHQGVHYLVMEYVEGRDLAAIVKSEGPLPVAQAVDCIIQAAAGLEYAHKQGVVHRDIKPGNLLVDGGGTVKILDMGLARIDDAAQGAEAGGERLTDTGMAMGTCDYMAPEQAEDTHAADHRADIYSLGCTLYRLLTGKPPYSGGTQIQVILAHREKPIPSMRDARLDVPEELDAVFQKMIAKRPEDRYQSMGTVIAALRSCVAPHAPAAAPAAEEPSSDGALTFFLQTVSKTGMATRRKKKSAATLEDTETYQVERETGTGVPKRVIAATTRRPVMLGAAVGLGIILLGLAWAFVGGGPEEGKDAPSAATANSSGSAKRPKRPPLAIAPFDAATAKKHQQAWADYLGVPVEWENSIGMKFVLIPPGEFTMGSTEAERQWAIEGAKAANWNHQWAVERMPTEAPQHSVRITKPFYMGKHEVTQAQWEALMDGNPSKFKNPSNPVEQVTWNDIQPFLAKLNKPVTPAGTSSKPERPDTTIQYALPTEAQWEYACRAGTTTAFGHGDNPAGLWQYAEFSGNSGHRTHPVGPKRPNAWGLYDMHGNVYEWCSDWYGADYYAQSPPADPTGPLDGSTRVVRGGGCTCLAALCRSAWRRHFAPDTRHFFLGFRLVCKVPNDPSERERFVAAMKGPTPQPPPTDPDDFVTLPNGWRVGKRVNIGPPVNDKSYNSGVAENCPDGVGGVGSIRSCTSTATRRRPVRKD